VEATVANGPEEITKVAQEVDQAEVADQVGQTVNAGSEGDRRTISSGKGYQSPEFWGVRRNLSRQTERDKARKAACLTAKKSGKEG
jgi:hypothetical protein